jgi:hypothetical protein
VVKLRTKQDSNGYNGGSVLTEYEDNKFFSVEIKNAFDGAIKVREVENAICALALRRVLEKVCADQNAKGSDLFIKLKDLEKNNIIPPIIDRFNNFLIHFDHIEFDEKTINTLIEFTQLVLDYVYILPNKLIIAQQSLGNKAKQYQDTEYLKVRNKDMEDELKRKEKEIEELKVIKQSYEAFKKSV